MDKRNVEAIVREELANEELNPIRNAKMRISADLNGDFRLYVEQILSDINDKEISLPEAIEQIIRVDATTKNALEHAHAVIGELTGRYPTIYGVDTREYLADKYKWKPYDWEALQTVLYPNIIPNDFIGPGRDEAENMKDEPVPDDSFLDMDEDKPDPGDSFPDVGEDKPVRPLITPRINGRKSRKKSKKSVEALLSELDQIIGMSKVKQQVRDQINRLKMNKIRQEKGLPPLENVSLHMVFLGNPGTGKTTIAKKVAELYGAMGLLSKGHLVITERSELIGEYVGFTAKKTKDVIKKALGGVLFIDEAYSLIPENADQDYGPEAIATLLTAMEENRSDFVVIVAGYPNEMKRFLHSNPGLQSRFGTTIYFDDYTGEELFEIFSGMIRADKLVLSDEASEIAKGYLIDKYNNRDKSDIPFANGRFARNLRDKVTGMYSRRIAGIENAAEMTPEEISLIAESDVNEAIKQLEEEESHV